MALALVVLAGLAYAQSLTVPFFFDDTSAVVENSSIRHLSALGDILIPPRNGSNVTGRPLVNLSFALNYAANGISPIGYHVVNLALHALSGLLLWKLLRRACELRFAPGAWLGRTAAWAWLIAAAWLLHPLQTESVICVAQRTELLVGFFYLLAVYGFFLGVTSVRSTPGFALSIASCALGMASKEVMVTAPLVILLLDRAFVSGSFAAALHTRAKFYLLLAATWVVLAACLIAAGGRRGASAGFGLGVSVGDYLMTQAGAILHYLRLIVWPYPLIVDYGTDVVTRWATVWPQVLTLLVLLLITGWAWWRHSRVGTLAVVFFLLLAPSSSVVPLVSQPIAEHRMYLPLACVLVLLALGLQRTLGRGAPTVAAGLIVALALATLHRSRDFTEEAVLWAQTVAHVPNNARAHLNLGNALRAVGRPQDALAAYRNAVRLAPEQAENLCGLAAALLDLGQPEAAREASARSVALDPTLAAARLNLANALAQTGQFDEAWTHYAAAIRLKPTDATAWVDQAAAQIAALRFEPAIASCEAALRLSPEFVPAWFNLGNALLQAGRTREATAALEHVIAREPGHAKAQHDLGLAWLRLGEVDRAIVCLKTAIAANPHAAAPHLTLAMALLPGHHVDEAIKECQEALRLQPDFPAAANLRRRLEPYRDQPGLGLTAPN